MDSEFYKIRRLPPYVFAEVNAMKAAARARGEDIVDLGMGNPDGAPPRHVIDKLAEVAAKPNAHRYSASRGIPKLRLAVCDLYRRRFGVELDPETEAITTIGAKEGLSHLMWVLLQPGDAAVVPSPSYPIHIYAPVLAGAEVSRIAMGPDEQDLFGSLVETWERSWPRPRVIILSFPHNPTTAPGLWYAGSMGPTAPDKCTFCPTTTSGDSNFCCKGNNFGTRSTSQVAAPGPTAYPEGSGVGVFMRYKKAISLDDIRDGSTNTLMVGETLPRQSAPRLRQTPGRRSWAAARNRPPRAASRDVRCRAGRERTASPVAAHPPQRPAPWCRCRHGGQTPPPVAAPG